MRKLQLRELQGLVSRIEYKSGWKFEVYETYAQGVWLKITAHVEDAYHPGEFVDLGINSELPPFLSQGDFYVWLRWRLEVIERHECHEWLRWASDGKPLYDPHDDAAIQPV